MSPPRTHLYSQILDNEVADLLRQIEQGTVGVRYAEGTTVRMGFLDDPVYETSNGWRLEVFVDVHCWDYVHRITTPDGRKANFDIIRGCLPALYRYAPNAETQWRIWGIPDERFDHGRAWKGWQPHLFLNKETDMGGDA